MPYGELLVALVGGVSSLDFLEGRIEFIAGDGQRFVIEVEAAVEGAVELAARVVRCVAVERCRVADQIKAGSQPVGSESQFGADVGEAGLDAAAFELDGIAALQDFGPGQKAVGGQVDQPLFAGVELGELSGQLVVGVAGQLLRVVQGRRELVADDDGEVGGYLQAGVVVGDGILDLPGGQVRQVAVAVLTGAAEEVAVVLAGAAFGFGVDQPRGAALAVAALAIQHGLEVVLQYPVAAAVLGAGGYDVLDAVEEVLADDGRMPALDQSAVDLHPAGVVRVGQHPMQRGVGDRLFLRPAPGRSVGQAKVGHRRFEPVDGVVAGGVELPGLQDQRCALRV